MQQRWTPTAYTHLERYTSFAFCDRTWILIAGPFAAMVAVLQHTQSNVHNGGGTQWWQ